MGQDKAVDLFLQDLQKQCLDDSKEYLEGMLSALKTFSLQPEKSLGLLLSCAHSLKGNLQAAGFPFFGEFVHEFETVLVKLEKALPQRSQFVDFDLGVAEFLISDVHFQINSYKNELLNEVLDSEDKNTKRVGIIKNLERWITESCSNVNATPQAIQVETKERDSSHDQVLREANIGAELGKTDLMTDSESSNSAKKTFNRVHLLVGNAGQKYAIPIAQVSEILQPSHIIEIPSAPIRVRGLIRLKDSVVSLLDLSAAIGKSVNPRYLLRCHVGSREFAFEVDEAEQVIEFEHSAIQNLEISSGGNSKSKSIVQITTIKEISVTVLDLESWVAS